MIVGALARVVDKTNKIRADGDNMKGQGRNAALDLRQRATQLTSCWSHEHETRAFVRAEGSGGGGG